MSLSPGKKLAHYEVLEPIGKGGMGEVYRARDAKLDRDVAIKVVSDEFAGDEERLRRFQREAKVLASLNHPNIASIYGLEQAGETHYLVLELVPGETLAERIARGPVPVEEALEIAARIAEALEEAHERGIVHRDLKPANVKLTPDDKVKVLDFGLAKAFLEEDPAGDASLSPTLTRDTTRAGVILGTAAYMSPEQARGKRVDKRSDIFSFGALLYEMLTGRKAFAGEGVSDVLAAVIRSEPEWSALPAVSPRVSGLLRRCLDKDARRRLRDIGEARLVLEGRAGVDGPVTGDGRGRRVTWTAMALGVGIALGALVTRLVTSGTGAPAPGVTPTVSRAIIELPDGQTQPRSLYQPLAISPDGTRIAYVAEDETGPSLFLREMDSFAVQKLHDTEYASMPFFSPDGRWIGFFTTSELKKIRIGQGPPVTLTRVSYGMGASWGPDDTIVYSDQSRGLYRIAASGGEPEQLTEPDFADGGYGHVWPSYMADGRVLFTVWGGGRGAALLDLESREWRLDRPGVDAALPLPSGHLLFNHRVRSPSLLATRLAGAGTDALPVVEDVLMGSFAQRHFAAVSTTGTLVYAPSTRGAELLQWLDPDGTLTPIRSHEPGIHFPRLSPDGRRITFLDGENQLWLLDLRTGSPDLVDRLTPTFGNWNPTWSPDGSSITFGSNRNARDWDLYEMSPGGEPTPLLVREYDQGPECWSPDGSLLVFAEFHPETGLDLWSLPRNGAPEPLVVTPANESEAVVSPDGRWLAYVSDQTGRFQVYVRAFPNGASAVVSTDGGEEPMWSRDGRELYFRRGHGLYSISVSAGSDWAASPPRLILSQPFDRNTYRERAAYDVAPDGRFLVVTGTWNTKLKVVFNWQDELERLIPPGD